VAVVLAFPVIAGVAHVLAASSGHVYDLDDVPAHPTAMVLGARAYPSGPSAFLAARLDLAVDLYERGALESIIVSGDGLAPESHDQPGVMRDYLEAAGVPSDAIVEDPGGLDTYDSCVRARDVYGADALTILSQDFHVRRAVTICEAIGVDAVAVGDTTMRRRYPLNWAAGSARELFANLKMEWDLAVRRGPVYDGD
jgi:vancomycin permeability regulator SanA